MKLALAIIFFTEVCQKGMKDGGIKFKVCGECAHVNLKHYEQPVIPWEKNVTYLHYMLILLNPYHFPKIMRAFVSLQFVYPLGAGTFPTHSISH